MAVSVPTRSSRTKTPSGWSSGRKGNIRCRQSPLRRRACSHHPAFPCSPCPNFHAALIPDSAIVARLGSLCSGPPLLLLLCETLSLLVDATRSCRLSQVGATPSWCAWPLQSSTCFHIAGGVAQAIHSIRVGTAPRTSADVQLESVVTLTGPASIRWDYCLVSASAGGGRGAVKKSACGPLR